MATRRRESRALRTIGQALKRRGIDLFERRCLRKEYYLQCGDPNPPYVGYLKITFSDTEITMHMYQERSARMQQGRH